MVEEIRWWTVKDVAAARGVSEATIRKYVSDALADPIPGRIPRPDAGLDDHPRRRVLKWREGTILPWIEAGKRRPGPRRSRRARSGE